MGLRINTNVLSLQAQNKLMRSTSKMATSLERLSSGLRINKGSDDVVGLLKSESLRSQIRGITAAETNLSNGQSLLGIAEGALAELTEVAQLVREKVVAAADGTISSSDRENLTTTINDLLQEFNRIALAAEFDGVSLLDGTFSSKSFQIGSDAGDTLAISISDSRKESVGEVALFTTDTDLGIDATQLNNVGGSALSGFIGAGGASSFAISSFGGSAAVGGGGSAISIASDTAAQAAFIAQMTVGLYSQISGMSLSAGTSLTINGTSISASDFSSDGVSTESASASALAFVNAINANSGETSVRAIVDSNIVTLELDAADTLDTSASFEINGVAISLTANMASGTSSTGKSELVSAINAKTSNTGVSATYDTTSNSLTLTAADGRNIAIRHNQTRVTLGITLNQGRVSLGGAAQVFRGTFRLFADAAFTTTNSTDGLSDAGSASTVSLDAGTTLADVDVSSTANAETGIFILDNVIRQLQNRRSDVGSKSIRFEVAARELATRKENTVAAESRIRDADVAAETAKLTASQILQQAGVSVLSRANAVPQIALTLLQG